MPDVSKAWTKNKVIPVSIGLLLSIMFAVWYASAVNSQVRSNQSRIAIVENELKEKPSKDEIETIKEDIKEIKTDIKSLLQRN